MSSIIFSLSLCFNQKLIDIFLTHTSLPEDRYCILWSVLIRLLDCRSIGSTALLVDADPLCLVLECEVELSPQSVNERVVRHHRCCPV